MHENVRQVSEYARLEKVYKFLFDDLEYNKVPDALIIYPDDEGIENFNGVELKKNKIEQYYGLYKIGVKLPIVK